MKSILSGRRWVPFVMAGVTAAFVITPAASASATSAPPNDGVAPATPLTPSTQITLDNGVLINPWTSPHVTPALIQTPEFRPTVDPATYAHLKAKAALAAHGRSAVAPGPQNVISNIFGFTGPQQSVAPNPCGCFPPDVNSAVGPTQILAIVNSEIAVFNKSGGMVGTPVSINTFFGYSATLLFDPRVLFDRWDNRWVVEAEGFKQTSTGPQFQFFAVSTSSSAAGTYRKFNLNMSAIVGSTSGVANFWDYPQIGLNQDGLIFTGNVFNVSVSPNVFLGATTFQFSLDALGNATSGGTSSFVFSGLGGTTTPPIVVDRNQQAHLLTVPVSGTSFGHTFWNVPGHDLFSSLIGDGSVTVPSYSPPAAASQPGTSILLDTSDSRIVNDPYQLGSSLFAVHAVAVPGIPALRWYEINLSTNGLNQEQTRFRSGISSDFNGSLALDNTGRLVICASTSDGSTFPSIECIGRLPTDPPSTTGPFNVVFSGSVSQTDNCCLLGTTNVARWGDTSSVSVDATATGTMIFWADNETVQPSGTLWSTRIQKVSLS